MKKSIYILGIGRNSSVYVDLAQSSGYEVLGLYHFDNTRTGEIIAGVPIIGCTESLFERESLSGMNFALSMGDNQIRSVLYERLKGKKGSIPQLIHPTSIVSKFAKLNDGVVVHANTVIQADVEIGENTVVSYNSSITHSTRIGKSCYIAAGANVGAYVDFGDFCFIGQGCVIVSGKVKTIGNNSIIGAGSVVIGDVEPNVIVAGNPARVLRTLQL